MHHCQRLLLRILVKQIERCLIDNGSVMFDLKDRLLDSSRLVEDMVSTLQSVVPKLNQTNLIMTDNGLFFNDEIKWLEEVQNTVEECDEDFCVYGDFEKIITHLNVS